MSPTIPSFSTPMDIRDRIEEQGPKLKKELFTHLKKLKIALDQEKDQTVEMFEVYKRYVKGDASKEEMNEANEQFVSFIKALGLGVLTVLPFSPITIPVIVNLGKKVGIDFLPRSFK